MLGFFKKFVDFNEREIKRYRKTVEEINSLESDTRKLKDSQFSKETVKLREQVQSGKKTLDEILPHSFALVREASRRVLGQRHYDVQLVAGIALFDGKIAEQKTGEGKTLSATTAMYTRALTGKSVHLVTVNDYLARRDAGWMGGIFHLLGMKVSSIIGDNSLIYDPSYTDTEVSDWRLSHLSPISRKDAYLADITYGVNSEFGFDYLRDNMKMRSDDIDQRGYYFAIVDEADSVLIDEARTPHIISAPYDENVSKYYQYAQIVKKLKPEEDYIVDEKVHSANLTEKGIAAIEKMLGVSNLYERDFNALFHIEASLKAETLYKIDKEYIVRDNEVIIVDEFTGRLLPGRRFSEGIHQAIEAKEGVSIQRESKTLATVSLQNYFRMYEKLAGMTGTAATEAEEFHKIYNTDVIVVPTHMPMVRKDNSDMIYKTERAKFNAVAEEIARLHEKGRPVLIGTTSIEKNEYLSQLLKKNRVPHELLNAKNHEREAQIIAQAGKRGSVTVATNMAGRGVDIILGGQPEESKDIWQKEHDNVVGLGGLYIVGTERHESRRIDNQLRGRSGRQGDPGESKFFVSLEDDLMRIFGGEQISKLMTFFNLPEDQPMTHKMVSRAIEQAQVKVEGHNFDRRKHLVEFDDVLNKQREIVYELRRKIMTLPEKNIVEFKETVFEIFKEELNSFVNQFALEDAAALPETVETVTKELSLIRPLQREKVEEYLKKKQISGFLSYTLDFLSKEYAKKEKEIGAEMWSDVVRAVFLNTIDTFFTEHLTSIEDLREGIGLRSYGQLDPLVAYKNEAYTLFENMLRGIHFETMRRVFNIQIEQKREPEQTKDKNLVLKSASSVSAYKERSNDDVQQQTVVSREKGKKIGRNDPCWCGSGKKYKKCHYPN